MSNKYGSNRAVELVIERIKTLTDEEVKALAEAWDAPGNAWYWALYEAQSDAWYWARRRAWEAQSDAWRRKAWYAKDDTVVALYKKGLILEEHFETLVASWVAVMGRSFNEIDL